jgi:hypothetical protein
MKYQPLPSTECIHATIKYNPDTGDVRRLPKNRLRSGGTIKIQGIEYPITRIIWKYMTGENPKGSVTRINLLVNDNRWVNLRDSPAVREAREKQTTNFRYTNQYRGVLFRSSRFVAHMKIDGRLTELGYFRTAEQASCCYEMTAKLIHQHRYQHPNYDWIDPLII